MRTHQFTVPGRPRGKERPRFDGRRKRTYTPKQTESYEKLVRTAALLAGCKFRISGPIEARIVAYFKATRDHSNKLRQASPDLDNIVKSVLDALNGVCFIDDSQIAKLSAEKWYGERGDAECVEVTLTEITEV